MCDEFQKALATYDQQMEGLDFHTQCEEARLAHLMDEEAYRKNLVDEARKECELVQNEMDQLESEVDSTVQMCMDQVEKEAELEGLLKETTARCAQAGEHLDQAKDDVLRQSNVLKEIDEELKQISAPVVDTTVADKEPVYRQTLLR
ncbi:hypothetical protein Tcan_03864 [Toxocara canis]|uniref:Uncharacterized protein n=1 Tax=Toxocara canis TaxID=6265 RepID=A0A0B2V5F4_TOXCA|nr:hypothetical protein Tcan_03864 [Toxocara canis]